MGKIASFWLTSLECKHLTPELIRYDILLLEFFRQKRFFNQFNSSRIRFLEHFQFLSYDPVIQPYPSAELDKVFVAYVMSVGVIHSLLEQSVF